MARDLKLELREILALHEASLRLEHAIRELSRPDDPWQDFAPSRFIYAFFTFNSIYSWDWQTSFESGCPSRWEAKPNGHYPTEVDQFKAYVRFCSDTLHPDAPTIFTRRFVEACDTMRVSDSAVRMGQLDITNADKQLKKLGEQMPKPVERLYAGTVTPQDFHSSACHVLRFVYGVRCNLFHGQKTHVQLLDAKQQARMLVYAALLTAANGLLFDATARRDIGFKSVHLEFLKGEGPTNGSTVPKK